jgi:hypothetical protein
VRYTSKEGPAAQRPQLIIQQVAPPSLEAFAPAKGPAGVEVTIHGTGFIGATGVSFGNVPAASFTVDSDTQIRAIVPTGAATGKVTVLKALSSATSALDFEITLAPSVSAINPTSGSSGTEVTITGAGFSGATSVKFGDMAASSFTVDSDTRIRAIVPAGAATGKITVVTSNGTGISAASFVVTPATSPLHRVYVPMLLGGGGNTSNARDGGAAVYTAFSSDWRTSGNPQAFLCALDLQ